jgi:hypothetical protein
VLIFLLSCLNQAYNLISKNTRMQARVTVYRYKSIYLMVLRRVVSSHKACNVSIVVSLLEFGELHAA